MISPSLDHLPFMLGGADVSVTIEQQIPLSGIRGHRRASALADVDRLRAEASRTSLDVGIEAANAYLMLQERRRMAALVDEQIAFARDVVNAANASTRAAWHRSRMCCVPRLKSRDLARSRALVGEVRAPKPCSIRVLRWMPIVSCRRSRSAFTQPVPAWTVIKAGLTSRPELAAGRAEIARAEADVQVMRDMFNLMATIRTGPSYTMAEGRGWMAMVGISLPIWRDKLHAGVAEAEAMRAMSKPTSAR